MRTTFLAACTTFACTLVMAAATPAAPSAATESAAASLQIATIMCGSSGCVPIRTKQEGRRKFQTMGHG